MKPVYLPNATTIGYAKHTAERGDIVFFDEGAGREIGRVLGTVARDGLGQEYREPGQRSGTTRKAPRLLVLVLGSDLSHAYIRHVDRRDVKECRTVRDNGAFLGWFFCGELAETEAIERSARHGSLAESYFAESCNPNGSLRPK